MGSYFSSFCNFTSSSWDIVDGTLYKKAWNNSIGLSREKQLARSHEPQSHSKRRQAGNLAEWYDSLQPPVAVRYQIIAFDAET